MKPGVLLLTAVVVVSNVLGNFALGWGMKHAPRDAGPILALIEPAVLLGILLLIAWTLLRMKLLGIADLSFVLPVTAVGYVLNALMGAVFLGEQISGGRWLGTVLIMAGASLAGATEQATGPGSGSNSSC